MPAHVATRADDADKHGSDITGLVFQDGKVYSSGNDGKIKAWTEDLTKLAEVQAHELPVFSIAASEDTIFSASNDGTVKTWEPETLKANGVLIEEEQTEYWVVKCFDGVLYASDDQCNVLLYEDGEPLGTVSTAEPIKDLAVYRNVLFTTKDTDVAVTELVFGGETLQYTSQAPVVGRGPIFLIGNKLALVDRDGKNILIYETSYTGHLKAIAEHKPAHEMIINAFSGANWNGHDYLFSGGWDKVVKQWKITGNTLTETASVNVDIVINALTVGANGIVYAGGSDGHIVRVDF